MTKATCCAVDDEDVEDNVVGVHGDNGLAVERVPEGSERHDFVEPLAKLLMRRVLRLHAGKQASHTHLHPRCEGSPHRHHRPSPWRWFDCITCHVCSRTMTACRGITSAAGGR